MLNIDFSNLPIKSCIFQKDTTVDRSYLFTYKEKEHSNYIDFNTSIVYIYKLVDRYINYPIRDGNVIYIGESCKKKNPTGLRFSQHISFDPHKGATAPVNYTVHKYYWQGYKIQLDIYIVDDSDRENIESELIDYHIKKYGSMPIGQGSSGKKVNDIESIDENKFDKFI